MAIRLLLIVLALTCATNQARAWVYPEHRDIALLGIENLDPQRRALLNQLWTEVRVIPW